MPTISGINHISLTVTDLDVSTSWYTGVLGFTLDAEVEGDGFTRTRLTHPDAPIVLALTAHDDGPDDPFDERRVGLDHIAFAVPTLDEVEEWSRRFDVLNVEHSEIKARSGGAGERAMITLRDPDGIQLEVFALEA